MADSAHVYYEDDESVRDQSVHTIGGRSVVEESMESKSCETFSRKRSESIDVKSV